MRIKTVTRWDKIREFINLWLKDNQVYCGNCNCNYHEAIFPCCEDPSLGTNIKFTKDIIEGVKELRKVQQNPFASTKKKTFRTLIKLPKRLFSDLDKFCKLEWNEKLFSKQTDHTNFAKKFPQFAVPERI